MKDAEHDLRVEQEADRWFARLRAPDCAAAERHAFERWRQVPAHARAYAARDRLWQRLGAADAVADPRLGALRQRVLERTAPGRADRTGGSDLRSALATLAPRSPASSHRPRRRLGRVGMAALAAGVCGLAVVFGLRTMGDAVPPVVHASVGSLREVTLDDGTRVQLDVDTEMAVRYGARGRTVELRHGRALFDVVHDATRPFRVDLGDSRVTVLGTRFQASRDPERVNVLLDSGSLRLDSGPGMPARSGLLVPGDQISYSPRSPSAWQQRRVDSAAAIAWSRGRLVFRATPLAEAVREINLYARPRLRLADPALAELQVSGNFFAGDSVLVADTWAATLSLRTEHADGEILLLPQQRR